MAGGFVARKRTIRSRTKVKTGCATCRIRKVKCDEDKPFCRRCVKTGRTCDGYESPFRSFNSRAISSTHVGGIDSYINLRFIRPTFIEIAPCDIELLNRCFSTKTMFDVKLDCNGEATQVLQASLTDPSVRHAVLSLRALREDLETSGDDTTSVLQRTPSHNYGVQQYTIALGILASKISSLRPTESKSALLCCQVFISIEQVRKNYTAMAQHIIRGLRIMHEYRARPGFLNRGELIPAYYDQLPFLDVFIIKLFIAPCKFADPPSMPDTSETTSSACSTSSQSQSMDFQDLRRIAPNMRTELTRIATLTLDFLGRVSQVRSLRTALQLLSEKSLLLESLDAWLFNLESIKAKIRPPEIESISVCFLRLFQVILKVVVKGALDSSPGPCAELQTENDRLQSIADNVGERVKTFTTCRGTGSSGYRSDSLRTPDSTPRTGHLG